MLEAGGITAVTDRIREADQDNPGGYYELEQVKQVDTGDLGWLEGAKGKSVKVISALLPHLPASFDYRVVFMNRRLNEVLASQRRMLEHREQLEAEASGKQLHEFYVRHLAEVNAWMDAQANMKVLHLDYTSVVGKPEAHARRVAKFLERSLDADAMAEVVDPSLYRNKSVSS